jgi:hypothetical protein
MSESANCFFVNGLYVLRCARSTGFPYFFSRIRATSARSTTCSSNALAQPQEHVDVVA